jgi:cold shock CspA family protein
MRGTMLWFNEVKDFGFIVTDEAERVRVPGSGFAVDGKPAGRCAGKAVSFVVKETEAGREADEVVFVPEVSPRRARRRHGGMRHH